MDLQQIISLCIVAVSALLLVRREMNRRKRAEQNSCGHDCGCSTPTKKIPATFDV